MSAVEMSMEALVARAEGLAARGERVLLGITGEPGAGKSTIALGLTSALGEKAVLVPMDGFHLANVTLERLGRRMTKGAPDTFDAGGYVALLRRIRTCTDDIVYAPTFDRDLEESIGGAIAIPRHIPLVITEGNYLLFDDGAWAGIRAELDEAWYVAVPDERRRARLIARHVAHGKDPDSAREWALGTDEANATLIASTRHRADLVVTVSPEEQPRQGTPWHNA